MNGLRNQKLLSQTLLIFVQLNALLRKTFILNFLGCFVCNSMTTSQIFYLQHVIKVREPMKLPYCPQQLPQQPIELLPNLAEFTNCEWDEYKYNDLRCPSWRRNPRGQRPFAKMQNLPSGHSIERTIRMFRKGAFWSKTRTIVTTTFKIHKKFNIQPKWLTFSPKRHLIMPSSILILNC